jgi:type 1 fimbria pilin
MSYKYAQIVQSPCASNVGSVVECSPATRAARVRFPDVAANHFATT